MAQPHLIGIEGVTVIEFWLSYNNGEERLRLPVNPQSITVETTYGYEDIQIATLGEYTIIGNPRLRGFSFSSFFPSYYNPTYCEYENIPEPSEAVAIIERWMHTRRPIRLTITGTRGVAINYPVTIRSFTYEERAGHPDDIFYTIDLREYRFIEVRNVSDVKGSGDVKIASSSGRPSAYEPPASYTVKRGDSLWKISAMMYKDGGVGWRKIYEANRNVIGKNPNLIYPGQVLVIPR